MKLHTLKPHYYETQYKNIGMVYMADKIFGERAVRNGLCKEVAQKKKPTKKKK